MDAICQGGRSIMKNNRQGVLAEVVKSGAIGVGDTSLCRSRREEPLITLHHGRTRVSLLTTAPAETMAQFSFNFCSSHPSVRSHISGR